MSSLISRRSFLKVTSAAAVTAAAGSLLAVPASAACKWKNSLDPNTVISILYTNDVHTYIDNDPGMTYSRVAALKQACLDAGESTLLVDAGDHIQGTAFGSMDEGESIITLMNEAGYDAATLGNHEFDYGMKRTMELMDIANYPYLSCNFNDLLTGEQVLDSYKVFDLNGVRVALVGITTPESISKSTPAYFMNEDQTEFIYDIDGGRFGIGLYAAVQKALIAARKEADYVIGLGHLGVDLSSTPWTSKEVIRHTSGFDAFIDGHSHTVMEGETVRDLLGRPVLLTQTGNYLGAVGKMTITAEGISTQLIKAYEGVDAVVSGTEQAWITAVNDMLGEKVAQSPDSFYIYDPVDTEKRLIRSQETNLGDFVADSIYTYFNEIENLDCDIAVINGGGIRSNVAAGDWTYKTCKQVSPFGNVACLMSVSGQTILDALEFASRFVGSGRENGGFLHIAGAKYDINTAVANTVQLSEKNVWIGGPTGGYRVQNLCIYNKATGSYEPIDLKKQYKLAGMNYTLRNLGDGFAMFSDAVLIKDYCSQDYLVTATYAMTFAGGVITSRNSLLADYPGYLLNYENAYGSGRITIV